MISAHEAHIAFYLAIAAILVSLGFFLGHEIGYREADRSWRKRLRIAERHRR